MCLCICEPTPQDAARLFDIFDQISPPVIMFNLNNWVFHPAWGGGGGGGGGICPNLLHPTHIFSFSKLCDSFWTLSHVTETPSNTKHNVDQSCTHEIPSNTKHSVDFYHALTPMSCDVLLHNAMQSCHYSFIPCYIYDECYVCMPTHA